MLLGTTETMGSAASLSRSSTRRALNVLAFAPFYVADSAFEFGADVCLVRRSSRVEQKSKSQTGFSYAFGTMSIGVSWLTIAMTRYGGMPWVLSALRVLLASYMALFIMGAFVFCALLPAALETQ